MRAPLLTLALAAAGTAALATAPVSSIRPEPRGGQPAVAQTVQRTATVPVFYNAQVRPMPRPGAAPVAALPRFVQAASGAAVTRSLRPAARPGNLQRRNIVRAAGVRTQPAPVIVQGRRGSVCNDPAIRGARVQPISGRLQGCGVAEPVRVSAVDGVALSQAAIMDCATARALKAWIEGSVKPAIGRLGGGLARLEVAAHYVCRTRNHRPGARISEHGKGRAIDISGFTLSNGVTITVGRGWRDRAQGQILRRVHAGACGPFGTVLGPESDRLHQNHFHLDTARYRGGPHCR